MKCLLPICVTLLLFAGCDEGHPESDPLGPGSKAVTAAKRIDANHVLMTATLHSGKSAIGSIPPGTKIMIVSDPGYNPKKPVTNPDRAVKVVVKSGPYRDATGFLPRSHLRLSK